MAFTWLVLGLLDGGVEASQKDCFCGLVVSLSEQVRPLRYTSLLLGR